MIDKVNNISFGARIADIPKVIHGTVEKNFLPKLNMRGYTAIIGADVYTPSNKIVRQDLLFYNNKLVAVDDYNPSKINSAVQYIILDEKTVAPAVIDQHIHGGYGVSFHTSDEGAIRDLLKRFAKDGIGGVVATTLPGKLQDIKMQLKVLNRIIKNPDKRAAKLLGIHLEGPFLSPKKAGIHPPEMFSAPTIENFLKLEPENVKIVTVAPELDEGYELSRYLKSKGIVVSAGHSMASAQQVSDSGASQVTHIFNAMAPFHHRTPTIANEGLLNPKIAAEMIGDTSHLDPQTMDLIMKEKPKDKLILISDALPNAGKKEDFLMNGIEIHVDDNWVAKSDDGVLAGNMQFLPNVAKKLIDKTTMTFRDFVRYSSVNPAKNLKVKEQFTIREGLKPTFTVWDNKTVAPEKTFIS